MMDTYKILFSQIDAHTVVITPNRRLTATLHKLYQHYQSELENNSWPTPLILPLGTWIERTFNDYTQQQFDSTLPRLLNAAQEQFLWEKILSQSKQNEQLLQLSETAALVKSSWSLLKQWCIDINDSIFYSTEDYIALHHWVSEFHAVCQKENWIDHASLADFIIDKIIDQAVTLPKQIILIGFTETSPQLTRLLTSYQQKGCKFSQLNLTIDNHHCHRISLSDDETEMHAIAAWAKSTLQKHPGSSIGCVIPGLDKKRDRIAQIFSEVFAAENTYTVDPQHCDFNISAGKSLLQYPVINAALQLLGLHKKTISIETLSYLLRTPFIGEAEREYLQRANYDSLLRQKNINSIAVRYLISADNNTLSLSSSCASLGRRIQDFMTCLETTSKKMTYGEWTSVFAHLLSILGWPGERSLSSEEYQAVENWLELLTQYKTLDNVSAPVNYHQALQALSNMANDTIFQPKTPETPIQVLGVLEAAGLTFDYSWIAGMDDVSWPPQPKPNPLIPKRLQRELNMPHATAERELIYCQQLTLGFKQSAKEVIFSHADKKDEIKLQASPLIRHVPEISLQELHLSDYKNPSERVYLTQQLETFIDEMGPQIKPDEKIRGGVSVIKQQAMCPFKAFAEWRLHAHELESPLPGLRAKERGTIIHKLLETIWERIRNQTALIALDDEALNSLIQECITNAIDIISHRHQKDSNYVQLEKQRLHKLIWEWLQIEKDRPFFSVKTRETALDIKISQLNFSVRVDRIDELADGTKLIIDYKTGKHNEINHWFGERPEEPQLPIYAMLDPQNTSGICFAQIAAGEHCFKGVSDFSLDIKGIKLVSEIKKTQALSWARQLDEWNTILTKLSDDFYQGIATVDPKDSFQTCEWCALKPLCRINEEIKPQHDE